MAIFAIIGAGENPALQSAVAREFRSESYQIGQGQWIVSADGMTAKEISERLGIPSGKLGRAIVVSVQNYHGWHATDLWEWIKVRLEASGG